MLADWLASNPEDGPAVLVDDAGPIGDWMERAAVQRVAWNRFAWAGAPTTPWCPDGPFQLAAIKLPKGRETQRMVLHAVAARMARGGVAFVHGHNDEGIKSARRPCGEVFEQVEAVDARKHCRVWRCEGPRDVGLSEIDDWKIPVRDSVFGQPLEWDSWPGLFAHGRLDPGSKLLLKALPALPRGTRVLDWACGAGAIAKALSAKNPGIALDLLDLDALAVHAARSNVPEAEHHWVSDAWAGVPPDPKWDLIVSNPPWHAGVATDWTALKDLLRQAPSRLNPGGSLWMVTQRNVRVQYDLEQGFRRVRVASATPGFRVWEARL